MSRVKLGAAARLQPVTTNIQTVFLSILLFASPDPNEYIASATTLSQSRKSARPPDVIYVDENGRPEMDLHPTRRRAFRMAAGIAASPLLVAFERDPTHAVSEGPAYKPGAPIRREIIEPGTPGKRLLLHGRVFSAATETPVAQATLEVWSVQSNGEYDSTGFNLRGRQMSTGKGNFEFLTVEATAYGSRTAHFHFKVSAPGYHPLTTELYLPGLEQNGRDFAFRASNLLRIVSESAIRRGEYDFYLRQL